MHFVLALLPLAASVQAAITLLYPTSNTVWYRNSTVNMNWTLSDPTTDTYLFRIFLSNQDTSLLSGQQQIADSTNATAQYVRIALPGLQPGQGYIVTLVNTTDPSQVLAKSEAFEIQDGTVTSSTLSGMSGASQTGSSSTSVNIPNANTQSSSFPSSAFPTGSTGAARHATPNMTSGSIVFTQAIALLGVFAGVAFVLL